VPVALEAATQSASADVRAWATAELGRGVLTGSAAVAALVKGLKDRDYKVREQAAKELARHREPAARQALLTALNDGDGYVRRAAADSLAEMGDREAVPALMRRVADGVWFGPPKGGGLVRKEPYDGLWGLGSKDHALVALKKLAPDKVTPALLSALRSPTRDVRLWAADELGKHKDKAAVKDLCAGLKDADSLVRRHAADALAAIGDPSAADALVGRITDDVWVPVPKGSIIYNARLDTYDGFHGIGSKDHALVALKKLDPGRVTAALLTALKAPTDAMRAWAAEELGKHKDRAAVKGLCVALKDTNGRVRRCAAIALGEIGDKESAPALVERIADEVWVPTPKRSFTYSSYHDAYDDFRDLGSKENALKALQKLAPDRVAEALKLAAKAKNEAVRQWAEKELAKR
jgi:HEAT repeat protein